MWVGESWVVFESFSAGALIGDTVNFRKSNQVLVFEERGKPEYPEKNLSEQSTEPTNSSRTVFINGTCFIILLVICKLAYQSLILN